MKKTAILILMIFLTINLFSQEVVRTNPKNYMEVILDSTSTMNNTVVGIWCKTVDHTPDTTQMRYMTLEQVNSNIADLVADAKTKKFNMDRRVKYFNDSITNERVKQVEFNRLMQDNGEYRNTLRQLRKQQAIKKLFKK